MKPLMLVLDDWEGRIAASSAWNQIEDHVTIEYATKPLEEMPEKEIANVTFLMAIRERTPLIAKVFDLLPNLKLILQTGGHAYHIDLKAASERGIQIALGRRAKAPVLSVPELTIAMMLNLFHLIPQAQIEMRKGGWPRSLGRTLNNRRLGILGLGRHGSKVAEIAKSAFQMDVVAWERSKNEQASNVGYPRLPLDELLKTSDVVSVHLRLSPESAGLLTRKKLELFKKGSVLINTSRGAIIDETALVSILKKGPIAGAGLDVFETEPLDKNSPLRNLDNVMLTPHIGWTVEEVFEEFAQIASMQVLQYLNGTLPSSEIIK
ncbi:D-2-hydroxyacid dehydrogenase family protein [Leptospira adleri]|nr:D-2-hydroxyacid dehydrogenase family protein [Leptospira adleri]